MASTWFKLQEHEDLKTFLDLYDALSNLYDPEHQNEARNIKSNLFVILAYPLYILANVFGHLAHLWTIPSQSYGWLSEKKPNSLCTLFSGSINVIIDNLLYGLLLLIVLPIAFAVALPLSLGYQFISLFNKTDSLFDCFLKLLAYILFPIFIIFKSLFDIAVDAVKAKPTYGLGLFFIASALILSCMGVNHLLLASTFFAYMPVTLQVPMARFLYLYAFALLVAIKTNNAQLSPVIFLMGLTSILSIGLFPKLLLPLTMVNFAIYAIASSTFCAYKSEKVYSAIIKPVMPEIPPSVKPSWDSVFSNVLEANVS